MNSLRQPFTKLNPVLTRPAEKRELVDYAHGIHKLSLRQACILFAIRFSVYKYHPKPSHDAEVREALAGLAEMHSRWGFWMMHHRLRNVGHAWNHKRVYRIYTQMGLKTYQNSSS
jgi:putative transposase